MKVIATIPYKRNNRRVKIKTKMEEAAIAISIWILLTAAFFIN